MTNTLRGILIALGLAIVAVGIYLGGFWLQKDATNRNYEVTTNTQQYQSGLVSQERDRVTAYTQATDAGQKALIKGQFCSVYDTLTQPPADLAAAHSQICF